MRTRSPISKSYYNVWEKCTKYLAQSLTPIRPSIYNGWISTICILCNMYSYCIFIDTDPRLGRRYCIYLSLFSSDNPEAVDIMYVTNVRTRIAETSIYPWEGPSTNCQGKEEDFCFTATLQRKSLRSFNTAAEILEKSEWLTPETNALPFFLLPVPLLLGHSHKSHPLLEVHLVSPYDHHELPLPLLVLSDSHSLCLRVLAPTQLSPNL